MAGIDTLLKGAVGALAKDKVSPFLSPSQRDFLSLVLNPQGYLLDTGITAAANALGYGSQYRELKGGAEGNKEYYKEVMRDTIGNALPDSIGDFVRATPRISEVDLQPAGVYTAWNPDTQSYETQQSNSPAVVFDQFANQRFDAAYNSNSPYNTNSQNYVGPVIPSTQNDVYYGNMSELLEMLNSYKAEAVPETVITGTQETAPDGYTFNADTGEIIPSRAGGDFAPIDFGGTMDYSDIFGGGGGGGRNLEMYAGDDFGGFGGGFRDDMPYQINAMAKGGQVCGCKH